MSVITRILSLAAAAVLLPGLTATSAQAAVVVTCGATLKADATLTRDLTCPAGNGITLYRGVTLNLGGHTLAGPTTKGTGVTLSAKGGSVVTNGTIRGWQVGVAQSSPANCCGNGPDLPLLPTSKLMTVDLVKAPVQLDGAMRLSIAGSTLTNSPVRAGGENGREMEVTVTGSKLTASPIDMYFSVLTITGSTLTRSSVLAAWVEMKLSGSTVSGSGISHGGTGELLIDRTVMDGTGYSDGPVGCSETGITVTNSTIKNYPAPIDGYWCVVRLTNNTFSNNPGGALGYTAQAAELGIVAYVSNNRFTTSGVVLDTGPMIATGNVFDRNVTGIVLGEPSFSTVTGNTFTNNSSSGIRTNWDGLTLKNNKAYDNGRYGIYAPNAVDLGGNVAYRNKLGQCVGLVCAGR